MICQYDGRMRRHPQAWCRDLRDVLCVSPNCGQVPETHGPTPRDMTEDMLSECDFTPTQKNTGETTSGATPNPEQPRDHLHRQITDKSLLKLLWKLASGVKTRSED